jgi:hypothetical protein
VGRLQRDPGGDAAAVGAQGDPRGGRGGQRLSRQRRLHRRRLPRGFVPPAGASRGRAASLARVRPRRRLLPRPLRPQAVVLHLPPAPAGRPVLAQERAAVRSVEAEGAGVSDRRPAGRLPGRDPTHAGARIGADRGGDRALEPLVAGRRHARPEPRMGPHRGRLLEALAGRGREGPGRAAGEALRGLRARCSRAGRAHQDDARPLAIRGVARTAFATRQATGSRPGCGGASPPATCAPTTRAASCTTARS